jgi:hypothetical protein
MRSVRSRRRLASRPGSLHVIPTPAGWLVISKHANKNGAIESRIIGLFDPATGVERLGLWEHSGALASTTGGPASPQSGAYAETPFAQTGDPIPGKTDQVGSFFHCGAGMVGAWQCGFSTVTAKPPGSGQHWMAWCDDASGPFGQTTRLLSAGDSVSGMSHALGGMNGFDYVHDAADPSQGHLYGTVTSLIGESVMLHIPVTSTLTGPSFGTPQVLMNSQTPVPGGAPGERFSSYGFRVASGSVAFRGSSAAGQQGIYDGADASLESAAPNEKLTPPAGQLDCTPGCAAQDTSETAVVSLTAKIRLNPETRWG